MTLESPHANLIGQSPLFLEAMEKVTRLAQLQRPLLLLGERGTGKELAAAQAHYLSPRWDKPFLKVNCAALTDSLLASDLFGHEAGAFTGADKRRKGRFERADQGSLFLDEIANASLPLQETVLRVIEYGEFERLGSNQIQNVSVRILAATHADLRKQVEEQRFRADLLDRLAFDVVTLPPLRERREDILLLAEHFAQNFCAEYQQDYFTGFTIQAQSILQKHDWPGNVRELKNTVERSLAHALFSDNKDKPIDHIQLDPFASSFTHQKNTSLALKDQKEASFALLPRKGESFRECLLQYERKILLQALSETQYHQGKAAKILKLSYHQLRGLLRKHDLIPCRQYRTSRDQTQTS